MENLSSCLICGSENIQTFLECKDHFLTKENFIISQCNNCNFRFVNPRPKREKIGAYYQSDDYISHSESKKGIVNFIYNLIKGYTLPKKYLLINKYSKGNKILDIGCGNGDFLNLFKQRNWETYGIEPSPKARNHAITKFNLNVNSDNKFICEINDGFFDVITMWHVLEHIHELSELLQEIKRTLKKDGVLFVAVPNPDSFDAKHYKEYWAGYDVPRHLYHFNSQNIIDLLKKYQMNVVQVLPMVFDSFYVSMLSEKYKTGKNGYLKGFYTGFISNLYGIKTKNYSSMIYVIKNN